MNNLITDYLTKQQTSKWLHTNNNNYENLSNNISSNIYSSSNRDALQKEH